MASYPQDMIPHRWSSKVDMEVGVAASRTHQAIALYFWPHKLDVFGRNIRRPVVANPAQLVDDSRWNYDFTQSVVKFKSWIYKLLTY